GMMTGSFTQIIAGRYELLFTAVPLLLCALFAARKFDILSLGDGFARNLGLKPKSVMNLALVLVSLLTASVVVTVGTLPFIGLIVP
ncbi:iron chelate uptake ABC transporter family permease subunit, partial [Erysipelothrix rhusiopathiae]|nr:iron chelate uptake ABC transporter family permease subunit [Erysipelothrix rhusiopathiae]